MKIKFETDNFNTNVARLKLQIDRGSAEALRIMSLRVKTESNAQAPKLSGDMRTSFDRENTIRGDIKEAEFSFNTPYSAYQHEGMRRGGTHVVKNYTTAGTKKKYLEDPMKAIKTDVTRILKEQIF